MALQTPPTAPECSLQFHLVIRYKKGINNKVADMLSRPIISASIFLKNESIVHESYTEQYALDEDFKEVYANLSKGNHVEENDYHLHNNLLFHLGKLCIPQGEIKYDERSSFFSYCWSFWCKQNSGTSAEVLLLASHGR